jgi:hypothetical protein
VNQYLPDAEIEPSRSLATALFYDIKTDTLGLVHGISRADVVAYSLLQPLVDVEALAEIERAQVPVEYSIDWMPRSTRRKFTAMWSHLSSSRCATLTWQRRPTSSYD